MYVLYIDLAMDEKDHDIVKHMKGQSGWGWGMTSFLPEVDDDA